MASQSTSPFGSGSGAARRPLPGAIDEVARAFVSAGDFDVTGILTGFEPCSSTYWWIPELQAPFGPLDEAVERLATPPVVAVDASEAAANRRHQAARRPVARSSTAAA